MVDAVVAQERSAVGPVAALDLFGYLGIGILSGFVVTAIWYLRKLNGLAR